MIFQARLRARAGAEARRVSGVAGLGELSAGVCAVAK